MKERKMSEFEKELDKLGCATAGSGSKFFAEAMLKRHFGYWVSFESHEKIVQQVSALTIENEKLKADKQPVPKCVDDWFKCEIDGTFSAVVASYAFNDNLEAVKWVSENGGMGLLCKMYLYGYAVEREKLYYVKFTTKREPTEEDYQQNTVVGHLKKTTNGYTEIVRDFSIANDNFKFTEKEIKAIDERYWAFAVEV